MRNLSAAVAALALLAAGSSPQAHFPTGIADGGTRPARRRQQPVIRVYEPDRADIADWNKQVERKKAEKRAAKRSKAFQ